MKLNKNNLKKFIKARKQQAKELHSGKNFCDQTRTAQLLREENARTIELYSEWLEQEFAL